MELARLIDLLRAGNAYPVPCNTVTVHQTHISAVFLVGAFVYKIKKPVQLGFLDFSTLEKRRHFCAEEVRLNRRLAPDVYLGVVPIAETTEGVRVEGAGTVIEWAVKMKRLPEEATLEQRLLRGDIDSLLVERLAKKVASFHADADTSPEIAASGRFAVVARNARDNFAQTRSHIGRTVTLAVWERLRILTEDWLHRLQALIEKRAEQGVPRDTHGDLHLDHVYVLDQADFVIIDCIEFSAQFRHADPVADMAFLTMDLLFHRRSDLATAFAQAYFRVTGDRDGEALLPYYVAYRSIVRAKVDGIAAGESEVPEQDRHDARLRARAHWLLALQQLEFPGKRPALVLVGGLPGTGKSTLARMLAERAGFQVIRSDEVRKELAGIRKQEAATAKLDEQAYSHEWNQRTYSECRRRAEELLANGERVIVDATFRTEEYRQAFVYLADEMRTPVVLLICQANAATVKERMERRRNDVSDADWQVHLKAASLWEEPGQAVRHAFTVSTDSAVDDAVEAALAQLGQIAM